MFLKVMAPDHAYNEVDGHKPFRLYSGVKSVEFDRDHAVELGHSKAFAHVTYEDGTQSESIIVNANVYVMNDAGRTIASFNPDKLED